MATLIELDGLGALILFILFIMFGVPIILLIIGLTIRPKRPKASKILLISAAVYVTIGLGICGSMYI